MLAVKFAVVVCFFGCFWCCYCCLCWDKFLLFFFPVVVVVVVFVVAIRAVLVSVSLFRWFFFRIVFFVLFVVRILFVAVGMSCHATEGPVKGHPLGLLLPVCCQGFCVFLLLLAG